jgi:phosphoribosylformylglycinamidine cyclo-ligase
VADALLAVHRSYLNDMRSVWSKFGREAVHGLAHITGGGFYDNIPRVVPDGLCVEVDPSTWTPLPVFKLIAEKGSVSDSEMYRVFNMGIGMVVISAPEVDLGQLEGLGATEIGQVSRGTEKVRLPF